jgi:hypothetical protein
VINVLRQAAQAIKNKGDLKMVDWLLEMIEAGSEEVDRDIKRIETFKEAGILTSNEGLVVTFSDGEEYQISIVRSK